MSSRDIRFSDAVKVPCDSGDGRVRRGVADPLVPLLVDVAFVVTEAVDEVAGEVVVVGREGDRADGRADVAVDVEVDDEVDELR